MRYLVVIQAIYKQGRILVGIILILRYDLIIDFYI